MLDKHYQPAAIEARVQTAWEEAQAFKAGRSANIRGPRKSNAPYCIVIPPPNVTGSLHMGHALNNTLQDILCRFERMRGRDVLWQPGTDHAGIATQMVVERKLATDKQPGRRELGREKFLEQVWAWKSESGGTIVNQLKRLGASCDWSRERFTMDEGLSKAVVEFFVKLNEAGLIYKAKRLVNWDPKFQTAISDLEVEPKEIKGSLWHIRYPLAGAKFNPEDATTFITVATTRPETMLGDSAVAVNPEDARYTNLIGVKVLVPLIDRLIPIVADAYSDPEKGSGAVKITPAHDFNDFEVGRRHNLEQINILDAFGQLTHADVIPGPYRGRDRFEARKLIVADLEAQGYLAMVEPHVHMVPHGDRSGVPVEPYLTDQWYVNVKPLADQAIAAVRSGQTKMLPANREQDFYRWMENIQPWCVSRQLWWGHQIPAWYGPDGDYVVAHDEAEAKAKARIKWGKTVPLRRDEDVLDTWFSSALWPFSTLGWPDETPELARYYPNATLITGFDILFFWVARMMMAGLFTQGQIPFHEVYLHGLVRDEKGRKMSKSLGNVIDPLDVINVYGADALRFTLALLAAQGRDPKLGPKSAETNRNFCTKLWNAARFAEMNECVRVKGFDPASVKQPINRWIAGETQRAAAAVTAGIEAYRFNDAAGAIYEFTWGQFCDWYLELIKPVLAGDDEPAKSETRAMVAWTLDQILKLLHPFMPFITEELWQHMVEHGEKRESLICLSQWPELDGLVDPAIEAEINWVVGLISEVRSVRTEMKVPAAAKIDLVVLGTVKTVTERLNRHDDTVRRLARLDTIKFAKTAPQGSAQIVLDDTTVALPLEGVIDMDAERARIAKEQARTRDEIMKVTTKLQNAELMAKAPESVVEELKERFGTFTATLKKLEAAARRIEP